MSLTNKLKKTSMRNKGIWTALVLIFILMNSYENLYSQAILAYVYDCESNLPVKNANVQIKNTKWGTVTNEFGFFKLEINDDKAENQLLITHVGYKPLTYKLHKGQALDSLNICLMPETIRLSGTTITANASKTYEAPKHTVVDFNFMGENLLLLVHDYSNNSEDLILTNPLFDTISKLSDEKLKKANGFHIDCMGERYIILKDWVYHISYTDSSLCIDNPHTLEKFNEAVGDCLFESQGEFVFRISDNRGFYNVFYAVNSESYTSRIIHTATQRKKMQAMLTEINWIQSHASMYRHPSDAILFEELIMSQPSSLEMKKVGDSIYLFDHSEDRIDIFSSTLDYIRSIDVEYHLNRNWNKRILFDEVENKAYTTISENNFEILYSIDLRNGSIKRIERIPYTFPYKTAVNNGFLYVLFKDSFRQPVRKKLYRSKLY